METTNGVMNMNTNELAHKVFGALYDEEDLKELHQKKIIAQPIGYKISCVAIIECEIQEEHDRLTSENARLREALSESLDELKRYEQVAGKMSFTKSRSKNLKLLAELEKGQ